MKTNIKNIGDCKKLLEVELPAEVVNEEFKKVYSELKNKVTIAGFRKGKAPGDLIKKHHGKLAHEEVTHRLIARSIDTVISEKSINPIAAPEVKEIKLAEGDDFLFKAELEVRPQIKLKTYKKLKIKKGKLDISDNDVEDALLRFQEMNAQLSPISGRPAKRGDWLLCDYKSMKGDKNIEQKENSWIALEEGRSSKDIIDGLIGINVNESRTVREKDIAYTVTVKEIKEKKLPALDDNFAKEIGRCENLDKLKELIRYDLTSQREAEIKSDMRKQLSGQLLKNNVFDCPASMIKEQVKYLVNEAKMRLVYQGVEKDKIDLEEAKMQDKLKPEAEKRVRLAFILADIANHEHIEVSPDELEKSLSLMEKRTGQKIDRNKENLISNIRFQMREEKTFDFLINQAKVTDKAK